MENTQFSILTALFGGKASTGAPALQNGLLATLESAEKPGGKGFFSFVEGLLTPVSEPQAESDDAAGAETPLMAQPVALARNLKLLESETTTGENVAVGFMPAPAEPSVNGAAPEIGVSMTAGTSPARQQPVSQAALAGSDPSPSQHGFELEGARDGKAAMAPPANPKAGPEQGVSPALPQVQKQSAPDPSAAPAETDLPRARNDMAQLVSSAPQIAAKAQTALSAAGKAAQALGEGAAPEAVSHAAVTAEEGGLEFDRLASSRPESVAAPDRTLHLHAVRDQIAAAVIARQGDAKLEIRLDPPELGRVTIGFEQDGADMVRAVISADTPETLDLMRRHADVFQRALEDQGFSGLDLHFSDRGPGEQSAEETRGRTQGFSLTEEETLAPAAVRTGLEADYGRLDRRL